MRTVASLVLTFFGIMVFAALAQLEVPGGALTKLLLLFLLTFSAILVHELGHAVAVHRQGGIVQAIRVLMVHMQFPSRRLTLVKPFGRGDVGGYVTYTMFERWWTMRKDAIVVVAGPAANFALAVLSWGVAALLGLFSRDLSIIVSALGLLSMGMGLANLLPFKGSDGSEIVKYLRSRRQRR
jgi:membrane-associated protease RseP (regulator of RpoE activity)